ncbi:MAG: hypothetical protein BHW33_05715 [Firmicutes bacterium CAG:137_57_8]|nr:MAG: hypothetical protein BHW33_05715 [Firmicutes bacterium CAG:137_57_8]
MEEHLLHVIRIQGHADVLAPELLTGTGDDLPLGVAHQGIGLGELRCERQSLVKLCGDVQPKGGSVPYIIGGEL